MINLFISIGALFELGAHVRFWNKPKENRSQFDTVFLKLALHFLAKIFHVTASNVVSSPPININRMECKFLRRWLTAGGGCIDGHEPRFFPFFVWSNDNERDISIHGFAHVSRENKLINYLFFVFIIISFRARVRARDPISEMQYFSHCYFDVLS